MVAESLTKTKSAENVEQSLKQHGKLVLTPVEKKQIPEEQINRLKYLFNFVPDVYFGFGNTSLRKGLNIKVKIFVREHCYNLRVTNMELKYCW